MKHAVKPNGKSLSEKAEFYLSKVQQVANIGFWELDLILGKTWWSDELYKIFQFDPIEGPPSVEKYTSRIHPDDYEKTMSERASAIAKGQNYSINLRIIREDGTIRHLINDAQVQVDEFGKTICVFGVVQDVTDRVQREQVLAEQNMKITNQNHLVVIGEVASRIAHEINNPLAIIVGKVGRMKIQAGKKEPAADFIKDIEVIERAAMRATKIINSLREISDLNSSNEHTKIGVSDILKTTLLLCREKITSQGIQLITHVQEGIYVSANQSEIVHALLAFLNNSYDAVVGTPNSWINLDISKEAHSDVVITITDSGLGIPQAIADKLMTPFFTTKPVGQGIGLSLSMARSIIDKHGGVIKLDRTSKNTKFVIRLPDFDDMTLVPVSIDEAIEAHLKWKQRLLNYSVKPDGSLDPKAIKSDSLCSLGKWIYHPKNNFFQLPIYKELKEKHKKFHECTALLVEKINKGEDVSSELAFSEESSYAKISKEVVNLLESLKIEKLKQIA